MHKKTNYYNCLLDTINQAASYIRLGSRTALNYQLHLRHGYCSFSTDLIDIAQSASSHKHTRSQILNARTQLPACRSVWLLQDNDKCVIMLFLAPLMRVTNAKKWKAINPREKEIFTSSELSLVQCTNSSASWQEHAITECQIRVQEQERV